MKNIRVIVQYPAICLLAAMSAVNYAVFIFPNSFAPAGIDGICTMIQDLSNVSMGYLSLMVNIPLLIAAFLLLNREFAVKTTVYVLSFSAFTVCLRYMDLSGFIYYTPTSTSIVLAPIAAGAIRGVLYAFTLKLNASSGGTDILAAVIKKFRPYLNLMNVIFGINLLIALCAYFVYGFKPEPVICSIIYSFITSSISKHLQVGQREMIRFEIIAPDAQELCQRIFQQLHRTATVMDAYGAYSGLDRKMIICVIEKQKSYELEKLVRTIPEAVYFKSIVNDSFRNSKS